MHWLKGAGLVLILLICLNGATLAALQPPPQLSSLAYAVYDGDLNYLIWGKNAEVKRSIASITKVMTLLCAVELIEAESLPLDTVVIASARAASRDGTQINLKAGDKFTLEELLYATALVSANDAAVALAEHLAGSEAAFIKIMNRRAKELGLNDTNYTDCTGLLSIFSNNYSTALDQARLFQKVLEHDLLRQIFGTADYFLASQDRKIVNTHPLLDLPGVEGGKTGATTPAGHTLITSTLRQERRLITITLGAKSRDVRNLENKELLEWAFGNLRTLISKEEVITPVIVPDGVQHQIGGVLGADFSVVGITEEDFDFTTEIVLDTTVRAPVDRGDKLGELLVLKNGAKFASLDIVAQHNTGLASWLRRIFNKITHLFSVGR